MKLRWQANELDVDETEEWLYSGVSCHALAILEPKFTWTAFKQLNWTEEEEEEDERIFWSRLAGGACNVGHSHFLRVAKCVALPHGSAHSDPKTR